MSMIDIVPINGNILIEPKVHESFISSTKESYEEIGIVISNGGISSIGFELIPEEGDEVYFDSWLAAKYPDGKGGFYWMVKYEDIRALRRRHALEEIPE